MERREEAGCLHTSRPDIAVRWPRDRSGEVPSSWGPVSTARLRNGTPNGWYRCPECGVTWPRRE